MILVEFKYVMCPVLDAAIRLKQAFERAPDGREGSRSIVDCVGAFRCGAGKVSQGHVVHDFSACPFSRVRFLH